MSRRIHKNMIILGPCGLTAFKSCANMGPAPMQIDDRDLEIVTDEMAAVFRGKTPAERLPSRSGYGSPPGSCSKGSSGHSTPIGTT